MPLVDSISSMVQDNPTQAARIDSVRQQVDEILAFYTECITTRDRWGGDSATALVATERGKKRVDAVRGLLEDAETTEMALLRQREIASNNSDSNFMVVFVTLIVLIVLVLFVVYIVISANIRALRSAQAETASKNWILAGTGEVDRVMQGNLTPAEIADRSITFLAKYLKVPVGAMYVSDTNGETFELKSAYALNEAAKSKRRTVTRGEGLVGQCVTGNSVVVLDDLPAGYLNLESGTGSAALSSVVLLPLSLHERVLAVMEFGSFGKFTHDQLQLLETTANSIALALQSAMEREQKRELLEETQRQAEELESQQEELRRSNEELIDKTQLLEESEEQLRAQQEELQQTNEELEEKADLLQAQKDQLENIQTELERKARELELTSKYKSEFLANMSHELRTPLNSILILSQLLADNRYKGLTQKEIDFARNIHGSGNDLLRLINEILDLAKVESGKIELDIHNVQFTEIMENLNVMFREVGRHRGITFNLQLDPSLEGEVISTDQMRLEQIVRNLLSNAFKFTERNGRVDLIVKRAADLSGFRSSKLVDSPAVIAFEVKDTGIGIAADKMEVIFEAFQQADGSTKRKYGGTGLGLSISRELAHVLGGELHVKSEEGHGSTFTLYMPMDRAISAEVATPVAAEKEKPQPKQKEKEVPALTVVPSVPGEIFDDRENISEKDRVILIIEDDISFSKVLLDFIREKNYKGIVAHQGNTGLTYARQFKPDAIMLDLNIPVIEGTDVLKLLKSDPMLRHIPVQIISLHDRKKETMALGAFSYTRKPVSVNDLQQVLGKVEDFILRGMKKLLIVEDNELQNAAISELIGNGDVKCFSAYSGTEAYRMLVRENFDCVILDLGLPDITGYEFLEKIKANPQLSQIPVIVYTGRELGKEEREKLQRMADTVVLKTAESNERLFDEAALFLHRVESKLPKEKQQIIRKLHKTSDVLNNRTVLIADDDMRNIYSLVSALEDEGINCITAENGKEAVDKLKEHPEVDLVLMDVMMPEMDGYEATREIRAMNGYAQLPILALTAKAMKGDREKCIAVGMSDYISKPVNISQLLSLMRVWLYAGTRKKQQG